MLGNNRYKLVFLPGWHPGCRPNAQKVESTVAKIKKMIFLLATGSALGIFYRPLDKMS